MSRSPAWLIESGTWPACDPRYLHQGASGQLFWASKPDSAIKFETEADAKAFAEQNMNDGVRVCQHAWL